jgi:hypothetical protein
MFLNWWNVSHWWDTRSCVRGGGKKKELHIMITTILTYINTLLGKEENICFYYSPLFPTIGI